MSTLKEKVEKIEKKELLKALKGCNWVMARAAKELGITERIISYKVKKYGIKRRKTWNENIGRMGERK